MGLKVRLLLIFYLTIGLLTTAAAQVSTVEAGYFAAHASDEPLRNLVYLALRVAGAIWIAVEWIAAIYLIRAYAMLRHHASMESAE